MYLNIGAGHWFFCDVHKIKWCVGYNLLSSWLNETEEDWERNSRKLEDYAEREPACYPPGDPDGAKHSLDPATAAFARAVMNHHGIPGTVDSFICAVGAWIYRTPVGGVSPPPVEARDYGLSEMAESAENTPDAQGRGLSEQAFRQQAADLSRPVMKMTPTPKPLRFGL
jgi:hypothetical protein